MAYNFSTLNDKIKSNEEWLNSEYFGIRTGRATPTVLDGIKVDSYGVKVALNQVANISAEDAKTLRILPYDATQGKEIEKAIAGSDIGLSVSADDKGVRVFFAELTSETRESLVKVVKEKLEQARITLRSERDITWSVIQKQEKDGELTEEEKYQYKDEMQKLVDEANNKLEDIALNKEKEIMG